MLSLSTVRYRPWDVHVNNDTAAEAALPVIARFGLNPDDPALRIKGAGGNGTAREQPASA
jgi:hypothetical protein